MSISMLSNISKIYERLMHNNMSDYCNDILSKFQWGFGEGFRTPNYLLCIIDTIRKACENHGIFPAVMTTYLKPLFAFPTNFYWYTNADLKTFQYLRLHMKIICWRFHRKTHFNFWDMGLWDMWKVCLQPSRNNWIC